MRIFNGFLKLVESLVFVVLFLNISSGYADDIEMFIGNKEINEKNRPNILFLIDDSMIMNQLFEDKGQNKVIRKKIDSLKEAFDKVITQADQINVGLMLLNNDSYIGIPEYNPLYKRYVQEVSYIDDPIDVIHYAKEGILSFADNAQHPNNNNYFRYKNKHSSKFWRIFTDDRFITMGTNSARRDANGKLFDDNKTEERVIVRDLTNKGGNTDDAVNHIWYSSKYNNNIYACSVDFFDSGAANNVEQCKNGLFYPNEDKNHDENYLGADHDYGKGLTFMLFDKIQIPPYWAIIDAKLVLEPKDMNRIPEKFEIALEGTRVAQPFTHGEFIGTEWEHCFDGNKVYPPQTITRAKIWWLHVGQCVSPFRYYKHHATVDRNSDTGFDYKELSTTCKGGRLCNDDIVKVGNGGSGIVKKNKVIEIHFGGALKRLLENENAGDNLSPISALMIRFSAKHSFHNDNTHNFKFRVRSNGHNKQAVTGPKLEIKLRASSKYNTETNYVGVKERSVGLRFENIMIPRYAKVKSAKIRFQAAATSGKEPMLFKICVIDGRSDYFKGVNRTHRTDERAGFLPSYFSQPWDYIPQSQCRFWTAEQWKVKYPDFKNISQENDDGVYFADVTDLVQYVVNKGNWCGLNAISFVIIPEKENYGSRVTFGYNYARAKFSFKSPNEQIKSTFSRDDRFESIDLVPKLDYELEKNKNNETIDNRGRVIDFNNSCSKVIFNLYTSDGKDDGYQWDTINKKPVLDEKKLDMDDYIGVRYKNVPIKKNAVIEDAAIWISNIESLSNKGKTLPFEVKSYIYVDWDPNSKPLAVDNYNISKRVTIDNSWNPDHWWIVPTQRRRDRVLISDMKCGFFKLSYLEDRRIKCTSPTLKDQLTRFFKLDGWKAGNAMTLVIHTHHTDFQPHIKSREAGFGKGVELEIKMDEKYLERSAYTVRHYLNDVVQAIVPSGYNLAVPLLYDAARYFTGKENAHCVPGVSKGDNYGKKPCSNNEPIKNIEKQEKYWKTPIKYQCQKNHIIYLTGNMPELHGSWARIGNLLGKNCSESDIGVNFPNTTYCAASLMEWLSNNSHAPKDILKTDNSKIRFSSVGFDVKNTMTEKFLTILAEKGRGKYYNASNTKELTEAINSLVSVGNDQNINLTNAGLSVSSANRTQHSEQLYYSLFRPSLKQKWDGNLKRYRFLNNKIVDLYKKPAVDESTGTFDERAWSFWSSHADGNKTVEGGAAENMPKPDLRRLYTDAKETNVVNPDPSKLNVIGSKIDKIYFGVETDTERDELVKYLRSLSFEKDGNFYEKRLSDPVHGTPTVVNYGKTDDKRSVVLGSNEGFIHIFDAETGVEQSAFMARKFLNNVKYFKDNRALGPNNNKIYGFDNTVTIWHDEFYSQKKDKVILDPNGHLQKNETIYAYASMRRGGSSIYALDISDPKSPKFVWKIEAGDEGFKKLGQTWSVPVKAKIKCFEFIDTKDKCLYRLRDDNGMEIGDIKPKQYLDVLIFGGGYDTINDNNNDKEHKTTRLVNKVGNAIYIVNARTGELIWSVSDWDSVGHSSSTLTLGDMKFSIPGRIRTVSLPKDNEKIKVSDLGIANQFFAADVGGQIWRFFINDKASNLNNFIIPAGNGQGLFAAVHISGDARKFYTEPDVSIAKINGKRVLVLNIGSGYRAHPLNKFIEDRFYSIRTTNISNPNVQEIILDNNMYDATDNLIQTGNKHQKEEAERIMNNFGSWYIRLGVGKEMIIGKNPDGTDKINPASSIGEKILSTPLTVDGKIFFSTYEPVVDQNNICSSKIGFNRLYGVNLKDGTPINNRVDGGNGSTSGSERVIGTGDGIIPTSDIKNIVTPKGPIVSSGIGDESRVNIPNTIPTSGIMYWIDKK